MRIHLFYVIIHHIHPIVTTTAAVGITADFAIENDSTYTQNNRAYNTK
ncbi:hypothetical protein V1L52_10455 [Treponema sp. HNW]